MPAHIGNHRRRRRRPGLRTSAPPDSRAGIVAGGLGFSAACGGSVGHGCRQRARWPPRRLGTGGRLDGFCGRGCGLVMSWRRECRQSGEPLGRRRTLLGRRRRERGDLCGRIGRALGARTDRLDIDDVTVVLAERADVDLADEFELHRRVVGARLRLHGGDRRRQRRLHVGEIEAQRRLERHRHLVVVALDRDRDQRRQSECVAREGRLRADAHAHRRQDALLCDMLLRARLLLGLARTPRQVLDDLLRQTGRQSAPGLGQQIDEQLLARRHRVDGDLAAEREAHRDPVGIGARRVDVGAGLDRDAIDRHVDRALERDDDDAVRQPHVGLGLLGEREHKPHISILGRDRELALHRRGVCAGGKQQQQRGNQQELQDDEHRDDAHTETRRNLRLIMRAAQRLDGDRPCHCPSARAPSLGHDASALPA